MEMNMTKKIEKIDSNQHKQFTGIVDEYIKIFEQNINTNLVDKI